MDRTNVAAAALASAAVVDGTVAAAPTRARSGLTPAGRSYGPLPSAPERLRPLPFPPVEEAPDDQDMPGGRRVTRKERRNASLLRAQQARSRATIRHLDIWTVVRVSLLFYLIVAIVVVAAAVLLWYAAQAFGTLPAMQKSIRTLFGLKSFVIHAKTVTIYMSLAGLVLAFAGAVANVLAAIMYNLIADVVGGVRIELEAQRPRVEEAERGERAERVDRVERAERVDRVEQRRRPVRAPAAYVDDEDFPDPPDADDDGELVRRSGPT